MSYNAGTLTATLCYNIMLIQMLYYTLSSMYYHYYNSIHPLMFINVILLGAETNRNFSLLILVRMCLIKIHKMHQHVAIATSHKHLCMFWRNFNLRKSEKKKCSHSEKKIKKFWIQNNVWIQMQKIKRAFNNLLGSSYKILILRNFNLYLVYRLSLSKIKNPIEKSKSFR